MKKIKVTHKKSINSKPVTKTHWVPSNVEDHIAHAYKWYSKPGYTIFDIETVFDPAK